MVDYLVALYLAMVEATQGNPLLAPLLTVTLIGGLAVLLRSAPRTIVNFLFTQLTTSLYLHNAGAWGNRALMVSFMGWYRSRPGASLSRKLSLECTDSDPTSITVGAGYGLHFFWFERRLFWFRKMSLDSSGSEAQKEMVEIFTYGRDRKPLERLAYSFKPAAKPPGTTEVHSLTPYGWNLSTRLNSRPLDSVIVPRETLATLLRAADDFYTMREWYLARGMAHKLCILLHGVPGSGKTSLIKAMAGHYGADIYKMNISQLSDSSLESALSQVPKGNIILLEDFDSSSATHSRAPSLDPDPLHPAGNAPAESLRFEPLSLTGVLNAFDGVIPLDNTIVIFTTNHPERIDPALLRPGRTDLILELGAMLDEEIKRYVAYAYGFTDLEGYTFKPVAGCYVYSLLMEHKADYAGFRRALIERHAEPQAVSNLHQI